MQTLYTLHTLENAPSDADAVKMLRNHIETTKRLFIYLLYVITEVARYSETDSLKRSSKNLPTEQDLNVNTTLAGSPILWKILEDPSFIIAKAEEKPHLMHPDTSAQVKKLYDQLVESTEYKDYLTLTERDNKAEKAILIFIFSNLMLPSEEFITHLEDIFSNWGDDAEMMNLLMLNFLHKPATYNQQNLLSQEKWDFTRILMTTVREKSEYFLSFIKPKLKNWDPERIATLDMILMQMGICEMLYFESIPTKVTINEYIDLAKAYSTPQSGQFINGVLDNIHKDLERDNKIHKNHPEPKKND